MDEQGWNFEQEPGQPTDETSRSLRAYFDRIADERMEQYQSGWTDEQVVEWDGNFRSDGGLMLVCCSRDVDVEEYRNVIEQCIRYRDRVRASLESSTIAVD